MSKYITVNSVRYPISEFNYRLRKTADNSSTSYIFRCTAHTDLALIIINDTVDFYQDNEIIFNGVISLKNQLGTVVKLESTKQLAGIPGSHTVNELIYYTDTTLRIPQDFSIRPYDTVSTPIGVIDVNGIVHYGIYSEVVYG
jgi:hypothetical protein